MATFYRFSQFSYGTVVGVGRVNRRARLPGTRRLKLVFNRDMRQVVTRTAIIYGLAFAASVATLSVAYFHLYWILIQIQTWRLGHPNPFTIGPAMEAIPCSVLASVIAFWLAVRTAKKASASTELNSTRRTMYQSQLFR